MGDTKSYGNGLFACKNIKKGEVLFYARGDVVVLKVTNKNQSKAYPNAIGLSRERWLNPEKNNPLVFLNHSCEPNLGIKGARTFVARRDIESGEHLTFDYSTTECDPYWSLEVPCVCGAKDCRKNIRAIQSLPKRTFRKYIPYIPTYFRRFYERVQY